jgi:hypothetical protein
MHEGEVELPSDRVQEVFDNPEMMMTLWQAAHGKTAIYS